MMYDIKVIWMGTVLGDATVEEFETFFLEELGFHVKYNKEFEMIGEYEGLHCTMFNLCGKEASKFAMFRIQTGDMKWFEDFVENNRESIPEDIFSEYEEYMNAQ